MTTSDAFPATRKAGPGRVPLRLSLAASGARGLLEGTWWPQSRDLDTEAAELVNNFPETHERVERLEYSAPHWDIPAREVNASHGWIQAEASRRDDAHTVALTMSSGRLVRLLVLPPEMVESDARLLMHPAASKQGQVGDRATSPEAGYLPASPPAGDDRWVDYGDEFWGPDPIPPSERHGRPFNP